MRVLIVENDDTLRQVLALSLEMRGFQIRDCACPLEAIDLLRQGHIDAVVTDFRLPHLNGVDLCRKAHEMNSETVTVLLTGYPEDEVGGAHYDAFFQKPVEMDDLAQALRGFAKPCHRKKKSFRWESGVAYASLE